MPRFRIGLVLLAAVVFLLLVLAQLEHGLNGPWYWKWGYRSPRLPIKHVYLPMLLAIVPALGVQFLPRQGRTLRIIALGGLMLSCIGLKLAAVLPRTAAAGIDIVVAVVEEPRMTSYYTDAASVKDLPLREWMSQYSRLMERFHLHTQSKPPGPLLYWWTMIQLFGLEQNAASRVGGWILGAIATLSIPAIYALLRLMLASEPAAFCGASFLALSPGFVLFFPMMDPAYPLLSCAMLGSWYVALHDNRTLGSVCLGLSLAVTLLISFSTLVLGAFMIGMIFIVPESRSISQRLRMAARHASIALATTAGALVLMRIVLGYNVVATFESAWRHQHELLQTYAYQRPYPATILFDLTDFALGIGWIGGILAISYVLAPSPERRHYRLAILAMGQLVLVAITGLLQSETSRVWCFMLPLAMIPIGLELSRWPMGARIACLAALTLLTAAIHQNMQFLY